MMLATLADAHDEARFGGKASKLARAVKAGLPVPGGYALSTDGVEAVADNHVETMAAVRAAFTTLAGPCAARSSAIGEDSDTASFAGQHLTKLNVRVAGEVAPAILAIRESARAVPRSPIGKGSGWTRRRG